MRSRLVLSASIFALANLRVSSASQGQQQVGPVYAEKQPPIVTVAPSGYDPFQLDWSTGRFIYTPVPYSPLDMNSPYRLNWHTGQWDHIPWAPPTSNLPAATNTPERTPPPLPSNVNVFQFNSALPPTAQATQAGYVLNPNVGESQFIFRPTTRPTTRPTGPHGLASTQPTRLQAAPVNDPLHLDPTQGRWQRDPRTGRWMHILPGSQ